MKIGLTLDVQIKVQKKVQKKLTYEELEEKVELLEKSASYVHRIQRENFENNQFLKILLDTIPSPIFYKDTNFVYQNCNDAFSKMILGIPKEKIIKKSLLDLPEVIPPELAKVYFEQDKSLFENPGKQEYKAYVKCSDGKIRTFMFYKSTLENDAKEVIGLVGIMLDISALEERHSELDEKNKQLETLSATDSLTGVFNRRKFDEVFPRSLLIAKRNNYILNFVIIDVDNFKLYNDSYGHSEGDNALKIIADTLQARLLRPDDYIFRLGGEEFGLLFYSRDEISALKLADSIRSDVQNLEIKQVNSDECNKLTISLGLITVKFQFENIKFIYEEADRLMYKAKKSGKNRVISKLV